MKGPEGVRGPDGARGPDGVRTPDEAWARVTAAFDRTKDEYRTAGERYTMFVLVGIIIAAVAMFAAFAIGVLL